MNTTLATSLRAITAALSIAFSTRWAAALELQCMVDGQPLAVSGIDHETKELLVGPERIPQSTDAAWVLEGGLRTEAALLRWGWDFQVQRATERQVRANPGKPFRATVSVRCVHLNPDGPAGPPANVAADWPVAAPKGGAAVVAWVVGGRVADLVVLPLPPAAMKRASAVSTTFVLSEEDAAGSPALLFWCEGAFVAPKPVFREPAMQRLLVAMHVGDEAASRARCRPMRSNWTSRRWKRRRS
jgi:hypothetical protein